MPLLVVEGLRKVYPGGVEALRGVSFEVEAGEVVALVGPNGAGKTTTFRIIATILRPTSGCVLLEGVDVVREPGEARKRLVYVPEEVGGYKQLTGREMIELLVKLHLAARGAERREIEEAVEEAVKLTGLSEKVLGKKLREYSKGMKRRVQVAAALAVAPRLAILDEPTAGLDVIAANHLRRLIRRVAAERGSAVLFSSHNMLEVEYLADRVYLIHRGEIIASGHPRDIVEKAGARNLEEAFLKLIAGREGGGV